VFQEGEPIWLKCHSWKNNPVRKVQYFQNGKSKKFSYNNSDFHIPAATSKHSGSYFCRGLIGKKNESSEPVDIIIQGKSCTALEGPEPPGHGWSLPSDCEDEWKGDSGIFHRLLYKGF